MVFLPKGWTDSAAQEALESMLASAPTVAMGGPKRRERKKINEDAGDETAPFMPPQSQPPRDSTQQQRGTSLSPLRHGRSIGVTGSEDGSDVNSRAEVLARLKAYNRSDERQDARSEDNTIPAITGSPLARLANKFLVAGPLSATSSSFFFNHIPNHINPNPNHIPSPSPSPNPNPKP